MKYFLILLCLVYSTSVYAQDYSMSKDSIPQCTDPDLMKLLRTKIEEYYKNAPEGNILTKRRQALILKNIDRFEIIDIINFKPSDNYQVANLIMNKKMNLGIKEENMRLCKNETDSVLSEVFLLIYKNRYNIKANLINFANLPDGEEFSVEIETKKDATEELIKSLE